MSQLSTLVEEGASKAVRVIMGSHATRYLQRSSRLILSEIVWLVTLRSLKIQKPTSYCWPRRKYFADAVGLNVSTVSRTTSLFKFIGLIGKHQRPSGNGQWRSANYWLAGEIWRIVKLVIIDYIKKLNRVLFSTHLEKEDCISNTNTAKKSDFSIKFKDPPDENDPWVTLFERRPELA